MTQLRCPECKEILNGDATQYICKPCERRYPITHGITCFNTTEEYYGELAQEDMREFLHLAGSAGWEHAVKGYLPGKNPGMIPTINDPKRISWFSILGLKGHESVLDFGCGLGGVSIQLARRVRHVTALDGCFDRIRFLQIRRDQERVDNIALVCNGAASNLPFPDESFDLVILNMVFPYLASTLPNYPISVADRMIVREVARTLKPQGQLYLSVRNRTSARWLKRLISPAKLRRSAKTFVAQRPQFYRRLLAVSGLLVRRWFWPLPNYKYPKHFVSLLEQPAVIDQQVERIVEFSPLKRTLVKAANRLGALTFFADTLLYVAQKESR